jgi:hypothetical protein
MTSLFRRAAIAIAAPALLAASPARAVEAGYPGWSQPPGTFLGITAASPAPGLYGFTQVFASQGHLVGPGAPHVNGATTQVHTTSLVGGLVWAPGWEVLGAKYDALLVQPYTMADAGPPLNATKNGFHNTVVIPGELSWALGDSGVFVKAGLAVGIPDGSRSGPSGLSRIGNPWWVTQPLLAVSYLRGGWNLTANLSEEFNSRNRTTDYKSGDIAHAEFTGTHAFGKWTIGPVATFVGQVSDDESSAFYHGAVNAARFRIWSVGASVNYNFGPLAMGLQALNDLSAKASGGHAAAGGPDTASITKGAKVFFNTSFRF